MIQTWWNYFKQFKLADKNTANFWKYHSVVLSAIENELNDDKLCQQIHPFLFPGIIDFRVRAAAAAVVSLFVCVGVRYILYRIMLLRRWKERWLVAMNRPMNTTREQRGVHCVGLYSRSLGRIGKRGDDSLCSLRLRKGSLHKVTRNINEPMFSLYIHKGVSAGLLSLNLFYFDDRDFIESVSQ